MKKALNLIHCISIVIVLFIFQACSPSNDIQPVNNQENIITVKVIDHSPASSTEAVQQVKYLQNTRHLHITQSDCNGIVSTVLDTEIAGNFIYSFRTTKHQLSLNATLASSVSFNDALEVDTNGQLHAYHDGSCSGTEYAISDNIRF